jgi:hypothetical protein
MPKGKTPEDLELSKKQQELAELETELVQRELDLATLQGELYTFESSYIRTVGVKLAELDEIEAKILEAKARLKPKDSRIQEQAFQARTHAKESATAIGIGKESEGNEFKPSERLKRLFREVAKSIHPDLAVDEVERLRRQKLMAEANSAYKEGDEAKLLAILEEWKNSPESVKGEGTAVELVRVIRKLSQIKKRLHTIETELSQFKESDLFKLKEKSDKAHNEGRNLLAELASQVDARITLANNRLIEIARK